MQFATAIEGEKELKFACAGTSKEKFLADLRRVETEKKNKISWYEFVDFVEKRLSNAASSRKDD